MKTIGLFRDALPLLWVSLFIYVGGDQIVDAGSGFVQICWALFLSTFSFVYKQVHFALVAFAYAVFTTGVLSYTIESLSGLGGYADRTVLACTSTLLYLIAYTRPLTRVSGELVSQAPNSKNRVSLFRRVMLTQGMGFGIGGFLVGVFVVITRTTSIEPAVYCAMFTTIYSCVSLMGLARSEDLVRFLVPNKRVTSNPALQKAVHLVFAWLSSILLIGVFVEFNSRQDWLMFGLTNATIIFSVLTYSSLQLRATDSQ